MDNYIEQYQDALNGLKEYADTIDNLENMIRRLMEAIESPNDLNADRVVALLIDAHEMLLAADGLPPEENGLNAQKEWR